MKLRCLAGLALVATLAACGGVVRSPGPPTPVPTPSPTPPPAAATFPELGLTVQGSTFIQADGKPLDFRGAKACCTSQDGEPDPKWPLVSDAWMDFVKAQGNVNFVGVRLGPWRAVAGGEDGQADLGGAYLEVGGKADLLQWNPVFWARIVGIHEHAGALGERVENGLFDGWGMKAHCTRGSKTYHPWIPDNNAQGIDACDAQTPGSPTQEAWIRKAVAETGRFHNAVYELSNEGILVPSSVAWEAWVISIVRDEEAKRGFPRHLIGSDAMAAAADFGIIHQNGEPTSSQCGGKPCVNNEYNPSPAFTPAQLHGFYCAAKARGTYYWYWRHEQTKAAMDDTLARIKGGCANVTPAVCPRPDFEDPAWKVVCKRKPEAGFTTCPDGERLVYAQKLLAAEVAISSEGSQPKPGGCFPDGELSEARVIDYLEATAGALQAAGLCAWHDHDAVQVQLTPTRWHELHPVVFKTGCLLPVEVALTVVADGPSQPLPGPQPPPGGPPSPAPPPVVGACPIPAPATAWLYDLKPHGAGTQQLDFTPRVGNPTHAKDQPWPGCGLNLCPLAKEKGDVALACQQALFGTPIWGATGGVCKIVDPTNGRSIIPLEGDDPQPFTVKVAEGACALFVKGSAPGAPQLGGWEIHKGSPACVVGSNGLCQ